MILRREKTQKSPDLKTINIRPDKKVFVSGNPTDPGKWLGKLDFTLKRKKPGKHSLFTMCAMLYLKHDICVK